MARVARTVSGILLLLVGSVVLLFGQGPVDELKRGGITETAPAVEEEPEAGAAEQLPEDPVLMERGTPAIVSVFVIPIHDVISRPNQFILRRGYKEAIEQGIQAVVLDIDTPGGYGDVMLDIMERTAAFEGSTLAYVNPEAISAGAFIAFAADEIWYAPRGVIGAAEAIASTGQDIPEGMRRKYESYVQAKMRSIADAHPYKAEVMRAMMDPTFVFSVDGTVLSPAGSLLTLTAEEALRPYGDPPTALFGEGIATSVEDLLNQRFGEGNWELRSFEVTWSERLAVLMDRISPILIGIGFLALFIEFKTPGFGIFGITGIAMIVIVFLSNYVIGLAGYEVLIFFFLGLGFVALELFLFPGTFVALIVGIALIVGSILWSMADLWPTRDGGIDFDLAAFIDPVVSFSLGLLLATIGIALLWRLLPESWILQRVALQSTIAGPNPVTAGGGRSHSSRLPDVGAEGVVISPLRPSGTIEIAGERFEAGCQSGVLDRGERVVVTGYRNFYLLVERLSEE